MSGRKKVSTTIYLEAHQAEILKALSMKTKVPVAVYIRSAVDRILTEASEKGLVDLEQLQMATLATPGQRHAEELALEGKIESILRRMLGKALPPERQIPAQK